VSVVAHDVHKALAVLTLLGLHCFAPYRITQRLSLLPRSTLSVADMQVAAKTGIIIRVARRLDELME
jgi:hypothetical protein